MVVDFEVVDVVVDNVGIQIVSPLLIVSQIVCGQLSYLPSRLSMAKIGSRLIFKTACDFRVIPGSLCLTAGKGCATIFQHLFTQL